MDTEKQFCVDCAYCKRTYPILMNLIPIAGTILWCAFDFKVVNRYCSKSGTLDVVTGKQKSPRLCEEQRRYTNIGTTDKCRDFLSNKTPLKNAPDKWLMDEILSRGLLTTMKNYKKIEK